MSDLKPFVARVAAREALNREDARAAFEIIMSGAATPSQIGGFLMALRVRGETVDEIVGAVGAMRARMLPVDAPADAGAPWHCLRQGRPYPPPCGPGVQFARRLPCGPTPARRAIGGNAGSLTS